MNKIELEKIRAKLWCDLYFAEVDYANKMLLADKVDRFDANQCASQADQLLEHFDERFKADDEGNALWPSDYPIDRLEQIKRAIGSREWEALYQQRPAPLEGGITNTMNFGGFPADADGWIDWNGGEPPVPDGTIVDCEYRNGEMRANQVVSKALEAYWRHDNSSVDIVRYRVIGKAND